MRRKLLKVLVSLDPLNFQLCDITILVKRTNMLMKFIKIETSFIYYESVKNSSKYMDTLE